jgi:hypothetical protein
MLFLYLLAVNVSAQTCGSFKHVALAMDEDLFKVVFVSDTRNDFVDVSFWTGGTIPTLEQALPMHLFAELDGGWQIWHMDSSQVPVDEILSYKFTHETFEGTPCFSPWLNFEMVSTNTNPPTECASFTPSVEASSNSPDLYIVRFQPQLQPMTVLSRVDIHIALNPNLEIPFAPDASYPMRLNLAGSYQEHRLAINLLPSDTMAYRFTFRYAGSEMTCANSPVFVFTAPVRARALGPLDIELHDLNFHGVMLRDVIVEQQFRLQQQNRVLKRLHNEINNKRSEISSQTPHVKHDLIQVRMDQPSELLVTTPHASYLNNHNASHTSRTAAVVHQIWTYMQSLFKGASTRNMAGI